MSKQSLRSLITWESGRSQLTKVDLEEGIAMAKMRGIDIEERDVRSACFQADLFITFMVRIN